MDIDNRYKRGEFTSKDNNHFADSLKYYTLRKHRVVYGGEAVSCPTISCRSTRCSIPSFTVSCRRRASSLNVILKYTDNNRKNLKRNMRHSPGLVGLRSAAVVGGRDYEGGWPPGRSNRRTMPNWKRRCLSRRTSWRRSWRVTWDMNEYFRITNEQKTMWWRKHWNY